MFPISDYCLLIESGPGDPTSDLIGVRRVGGSMFGPPAETKVDTIPRAGNSKGKVTTTVGYAGHPKLNEIDLLANPLAEWTSPYGEPVMLG